VQISRAEFKSSGVVLPLIKISSGTQRGSVIVLHGFGGCKEEQLGLGFRLAEVGLEAYVIDLRGHGQNAQPLSIEVFDDVNALVRSLKSAKPTITVGHSLGGRLSLLSDADIRIGISPALSQTFSDQTVTLTNSMRKHRVIEREHDANFRVLNSLPLVDDTMGPNDLVLYGERDIPEIAQWCQSLGAKGKNVVQIAKAMHADTFLLESSFDHLKNWLVKSGRLPGG